MRKIAVLFLAIAFLMIACDSKKNSPQTITLEEKISIDSIGIKVSAEENREYSFTDKKSGYWYGRTAQQEHVGMFEGWTVMRHHIFTDYQLYINDIELIRDEAVVYPNKIVRNYELGTETLSMFDDIEALVIEIETKKTDDNIAISILGDILVDKYYNETQKVVVFEPEEYEGKFVGISSIIPEDIYLEEHRYKVSSSAKGFFIFLADTEAELFQKSKDLQKDYLTLLRKRADRMNKLVGENVALKTDIKDFNKAFNWVTLTMDQLVTRQMGHGIYAGLPWFNDYWGRDMFISLPGSNLVTGQFDLAKEILLSFAKYQLKDMESKYYGRIPNRARPDDVIYNTTDGTPRFVIQIFDYVKYTGDTDLIEELYPEIFMSIDGSLKNWVDDNGYLTHEDADTWMDAKRDGKPFSPRGNRANDIQILWYKQLRAGAYFARFMNKDEDAKNWNDIADKLKANFMKDYFSSDKNIMADRILKDGSQDFSMRPNQLFAMDFMTDVEKKMKLVRTIWEELVYPWGVASLSQKDDYFHPYHHWDDMYFFDESYHNGTVWVWNNGIAMQRMIECGQKDVAFQLMENMQNQAMHTGAVGSISENFDALPREGKRYAEKTGTFLQAWSNAEYLRVWYQYFLGVRPNAVSKELIIAPRIPNKFDEIIFEEKIFGGKIKSEFYNHKGYLDFEYEFTNIEADVTFDLEGYEDISVQVKDGDIVSIRLEEGDSKLENYREGSEITTITLKESKTKKDLQNMSREIFRDVGFAKPELNKESFIFRRKAEGKYNIEDYN
ncbi:MAG: amylo-alpha-1,6-glucosidase [Bacteroidota bacterium]